MTKPLYWNTVTPALRYGLVTLMAEPLFNPFTLVGGTCLSLQIGHRESIDIDLFTDAPYGSVDLKLIDRYLRETFSYVTPEKLVQPIAMGVSYIIGNAAHEAFKLDLFYTDPFAFPLIYRHDVRMASTKEIAAMKIDVIQRGGRKKDFWDIHALANNYSIADMIALHKQRYPYSHDEKLIRSNLTNFSAADEDFDPVCLRGNVWELIKLDILDMTTTDGA